MAEGEGAASAPTMVYCPVCWGAGQLYAPSAPVDGPDSSCGSCCTSSIEGMEPYSCTRCAGTGLVVPAQPPTPAAGTD